MLGEGGQGGVGPSHECALADQVQHLTLEVTRLHAQLEQYAPISPLYSLKQAAALLPCLHVTLVKMLHRYKAELDPPVYRRGPRIHRFRMLTHRDVLTLRHRMYRRPGHRTKHQAMQEISAA